MRGGMYSWIGTFLLVGILAYSSWILFQPGGRITEKDALTASGMALQGLIPESYQYEHSRIRYQQVQVGGERRTSLEVSMIYESPEGAPPLEVQVYLDPHSAEVWGIRGLEAWRER